MGELVHMAIVNKRKSPSSRTAYKMLFCWTWSRRTQATAVRERISPSCCDKLISKDRFSLIASMSILWCMWTPLIWLVLLCLVSLPFFDWKNRNLVLHEVCKHREFFEVFAPVCPCLRWHRPRFGVWLRCNETDLFKKKICDSMCSWVLPTFRIVSLRNCARISQVFDQLWWYFFFF